MSRFSIVLPTRNRSFLLCEYAIPSILRQTFGDFELIVADNASSDDTEERVHAIGDSRIRYVKSETWIPKEYCFDWALGFATGEYSILFFDDDVMLVNALEVVDRSLKEAPSDAVVSNREFAYFFSNWYEKDKRNVLQIPPFTGTLTVKSSEQHLARLYRNVELLPDSPVIASSFYRTELLNEIRAKHGPLFTQGHMGDYNMACWILTHTQTYSYLDYPIAVLGSWSDNTPQQLHGHRATMPEYIEWIQWTETVLLKDMPIGNYLWMNCVAASLTQMAKDLEILHEIDVVDYLGKLKQEVNRLELQGVDMKLSHDATMALFRKLPQEVQEAVRNPELCGHPSAADMPDRLKSISLDWAPMAQPASGLGRQFKFFDGDVEGFSSTLEAAACLENWLLQEQMPRAQSLETNSVRVALENLGRKHESFAILGTNGLADFIVRSLGDRTRLVASVDYFEETDALPCGNTIDYLNQLKTEEFDCLISTVPLSENGITQLKTLCETENGTQPVFVSYEDFIAEVT